MNAGNMADLELLDNKELHKKLLEYGLPNVPVTDSTRKLLIRRLHAAMSGDAVPKEPTKNRRETVHVSNPAPHQLTESAQAVNNESSKRISRRTIGATKRTTTTTVSESEEYSDVSPDRGVTRKTNTTTNTLYPKLPPVDPFLKPQLSKTGVLTTSYSQETKAVSNRYAAPDEADSDEVSGGEEAVARSTLSTSPLYTYTPRPEGKVSTSSPLHHSVVNAASSTRYSSLGSYKSTTPYLGDSSVSKRSYLEPKGRVQPTVGQRKADVYEVDDEDAEEDEEDEVEEEEETGRSSDSDIETPYLSKFTRDLENIKATTISQLKKQSPTTAGSVTFSPRTRDSLVRRPVATALPSTGHRSHVEASDDIELTLRQFLTALEEKYHLKQTFSLILVFVFAVFIYVFFIQSV